MKMRHTVAAIAFVAGVCDAVKEDPIRNLVDSFEMLLQQSKAAAEELQNKHAKDLCDCDTVQTNAKAIIADSSKTIDTLSNTIEKTLAESSVLSIKLAKLKAELEDGDRKLVEARSIREKEKTAYDDTKADLEAGIEQLKNAIATLTEVGADQNQGSSSEHKRIMEGQTALSTLQESSRAALLAARAYLQTSQQKSLDALVQAPGSYSAQSGEVVGILQNMKDTFESKLKQATATEEQAVRAYEKLKKNLEDAKAAMEKMQTEKRGAIGGNDGNLASDRAKLNSAKTDKLENENTLEQSLNDCAEIKRIYDEKMEGRLGEQAACQQVINVLHSDEAFVEGEATPSFLATAGQAWKMLVGMRHEAGLQKQTATGFLQQVRRHDASLTVKTRPDNPFKSVLGLIDSVIEQIGNETKADKEHHDWCKDEREESDGNIKKATDAIRELEGDIDALDTAINQEETGLLAQISKKESMLEDNSKTQHDKTAERNSDRATFEKNLAEYNRVEGLLKKAETVVKNWYEKVMGKESKRKEFAKSTDSEHNELETSTNSNSAVAVIAMMLEDNTKDRSKLNVDEEAAVKTYDEDMASLKDAEIKFNDELADLREELAEKKEQLESKNEEKTQTEAVKRGIEKYLKDIEPGCDDIIANIDRRKELQSSEIEHLVAVKTKLKDSPVFKAHEEAAHQESLGDCQEVCNENAEAHAKCQACLKEVTVVAYCTSHKGTPGCN